MGYVINNIANITEPARLSLSGLPNFIQIASRTGGGSAYRGRITPTSQTSISVTVVDKAGGSRTITGTTDKTAVGGSVFYISTNPLETTENIKAALLNDAYISANYTVFSDISWNDGAPEVNGVLMVALEWGQEYNLVMTASGATIGTANGNMNDSIKGSEPMVTISADVYAVESRYIQDLPPNGEPGKHIVTLSKTYSGSPIWFDLNGVAAQNLGFEDPMKPINTWFGTGTYSAIRALLRKGNEVQTPFFVTEILYTLSGYGNLSDERELAGRAFRAAPVKTLTDRPETPYMKGQREYINFARGAALGGKVMQIIKRAYNGSGAYLGSRTVAGLRFENAFIINSCAFNFDDLLNAYPTAVKLTAALIMNGSIASEVLEYTVNPECFHSENVFHFINRYGGWDTFNFDGTIETSSKPENETYQRTVTPQYDAAHGVEGVYLSDVETVVAVEGAPVNSEIAEWLRQFAAAKVILNNEGRRIILEEFNLKISPGEMVVPAFKYRYSDDY